MFTSQHFDLLLQFGQNSPFLWRLIRAYCDVHDVSFTLEEKKTHAEAGNLPNLVLCLICQTSQSGCETLSRHNHQINRKCQCLIWKTQIHAILYSCGDLSLLVWSPRWIGRNNVWQTYKLPVVTVYSGSDRINWKCDLKAWIAANISHDFITHFSLVK